MGYAAEGAAIRQHFADEWAGRTPVAWPNADFEPPADGSPWVRLSILGADAVQAEFGAADRRFRHTGIVIVQVFTRQGDGDGTAQQLADDVAALFRGVTVSEAVFGAPSVNTIGPDGSGWWQINVNAPMYRDTRF